MFLFREAGLADEDAIFELARYLNTLNLPPERDFIRELLERSLVSFEGDATFDPQRRFLFVLEDSDGKVVGTSMIHAQHGTFDEPHVFFTVNREERHALLQLPPDGRERHVHMEHTMLFLGQTYHGPSELGGLVLHPDVRNHPNKLGRLLSLGRFVFIALHRGWIRERLLAELLPPLYKGPEGATRSPLWDALGHKFTGISYEEADRLSRVDKSFIWQLFPRMPVHAVLLPEGVQEIIGRVGPNTVGAQRLLESVGFRFEGRIDPFDGGPHLEVETDDVPLVRDCRAYVPEAVEPFANGLPAIVGTSFATSPRFRAVWTPVEARERDGTDDPEVVRVGRDALQRLGVCTPAGELIDNARVHVALRPKRRRADRSFAP